MFLSDKTILEHIRNGIIRIEPGFDENDIRPNGIRVHLHHKLIKYEAQTVDPTKTTDLVYKEIALSDNNYVLSPGEFVLGSTKESFITPRDILSIIDGRSTLARLGLNIHMTAASVDSLYDEPRTITLEIFNAGNIRIVLSDSMPIGALLFVKLDHPVVSGPQLQYFGQNGPVIANLK